eukprot:10413031-Lingulodinium_polyedra.AAC.1
MEDHFDDCGDDGHDKSEDALLRHPCDFDTDDELSDLDHDGRARLQSGDRFVAYPIDRTKVARAQPGSYPHERRDSRAPPSKDSTRPGCNYYGEKRLGTHSRDRPTRVPLRRTGHT